MTRSPDDWMCIGIITSAHGVHGEVRVRPETDFPERFEEAESLTLLLPQPWPPPPPGMGVSSTSAAPAGPPARRGRGPARGKRTGPIPPPTAKGAKAASPAPDNAAQAPETPVEPPPPPPRRATRVFEVEEARGHKGGFLIKFAGIDDRERAETLRGVHVVVRRADLKPLPERTWYVYELEGLQVYTEEGEHLGVLEEVLFTGGNDVYVVKGAREILLPAIRQVIREVDLAAGRMVVHLLDGL